MQEYLADLGYDVGKWGCDGDFWDCTELAVKAFQKDAHVDADDECRPITLEALHKAITALENEPPSGQTVTIVSGNCYIRTAPNTGGRILGVARRGESLPYPGLTSDNGWHAVVYNGITGWVSGKYGND